MESRQISQPRAGTARDAALRRASNLTKWACVGAVALVGALAGYVAQAKPGRSTNTSGSGGSGGPRPTKASVNNNGGGSASTPSSPSLSPPAAAPTPAPAPAPAASTSGGS